MATKKKTETPKDSLAAKNLEELVKDVPPVSDDDPQVTDETMEKLVQEGLVEEVGEGLVLDERDFDMYFDPTEGVAVSTSCQFYRNTDDGPYAAIVTQVNRDARTVHLAVFARTSGFVSAELDVPHQQDLEGNGRFWRWTMDL